jgi:hypothetical protein
MLNARCGGVLQMRRRSWKTLGGGHVWFSTCYPTKSSRSAFGRSPDFGAMTSHNTWRAPSHVSSRCWRLHDRRSQTSAYLEPSASSIDSDHSNTMYTEREQNGGCAAQRSHSIVSTSAISRNLTSSGLPQRPQRTVKRSPYSNRLSLWLLFARERSEDIGYLEVNLR